MLRPVTTSVSSATLQVDVAIAETEVAPDVFEELLRYMYAVSWGVGGRRSGRLVRQGHHDQLPGAIIIIIIIIIIIFVVVVNVDRFSPTSTLALRYTEKVMRGSTSDRRGEDLLIASHK